MQGKCCNACVKLFKIQNTSSGTVVIKDLRKFLEYFNLGKITLETSHSIFLSVVETLSGA